MCGSAKHKQSFGTQARAPRGLPPSCSLTHPQRSPTFEPKSSVPVTNSPTILPNCLTLSRASSARPSPTRPYQYCRAKEERRAPVNRDPRFADSGALWRCRSQARLPDSDRNHPSPPLTSPKSASDPATRHPLRTRGMEYKATVGPGNKTIEKEDKKDVEGSYWWKQVVATDKGGAVGGDGGDDEGDKEKEEEAERERQEAIREAEERRKEKHRKMEEEREKMRQEIRDKYNIKKKEEIQEPQPEEPDNPLMRKKKTPEELAREAEEADQDELTKLKNTIETQVNEIKSQIESKCTLQ
ncbi:unnamed protein product [Bemisia tabaci]|uniref:Complexin n=1 Tax=Bemisia tabaci TaxID=7038 RepID=A0A9P0ANU6_BEMTA|nr:unnamed protein product [Bemisia tabaci]